MKAEETQGRRDGDDQRAVSALLAHVRYRVKYAALLDEDDEPAVVLTRESALALCDAIEKLRRERDKMKHDRHEHTVTCDACGWRCYLDDNEHPTECPVCLAERRVAMEVALRVAMEVALREPSTDD